MPSLLLKLALYITRNQGIKSPLQDLCPPTKKEREMVGLQDLSYVLYLCMKGNSVDEN